MATKRAAPAAPKVSQEGAAPPEFKVGDVVRLRSGGLHMTVFEVQTSFHVRVGWAGFHDIQKADLLSAVLERVPDAVLRLSRRAEDDPIPF